MEDDALLGMDILMDKESKANILLGENIIKLFGHETPCISLNDKDSELTLKSADQYTIPPMSEMLIQAFVERNSEVKRRCYFSNLHWNSQLSRRCFWLQQRLMLLEEERYP